MSGAPQDLGRQVPGPQATGLRARGLGVRRGRRSVVRDVDLDVAPGEVVAILGSNGAGKSTLLAGLGGLLPTTGELTHGGRVATVLQQPALARRSARANVEQALAWWGVPRSERRARAAEALAALQADHLAKRSAETLSGGEARRVHLARGLAVRAEVLLLDEPFAGLDPAAHDLLAIDAAQALRSGGAAVVVVVHERRDAWALADRVVVLLDGEVAAIGTPDDLLQSPPTAQVARFLGYDGELSTADGVLLTRPAHVIIDAGGDLEARVGRVVRGEDRHRIELITDRGTLWAESSNLPGERARVRLAGGARFPRP